MEEFAEQIEGATAKTDNAMKRRRYAARKAAESKGVSAVSKSVAELYEDLRAAVQALEDREEDPVTGFSHFGDGTRGLSGKSASIRLAKGQTEWKVVYHR